MIHSMLVRQLETDKRHELWFEFARRPLRFSMQEYHAVTGLNCEVSKGIDYDKWVDDGGFWSKLLKRQENITLEKIWADYIDGVDDWRRVDRFRLIYLCVIVGVVLARGDKAVIPLEYIKVVMDMTKLRAYAWGRVSYDLLLKSVFKSRKKILKAPKSYVLEGFSYALQIWAMEAIPAVGKLLGTKLSAEFIAGPRCSNWQGAAKVSYDEIKRLEKTITTEDDMYPYISWTGYGDILDDIRFARTDARDCRVDSLNGLIRKGYDWSKHVWEVAERVETTSIHEEQEEPDGAMENEDAEDDFRPPMTCESTHSGSTRGKKRRHDDGFEKRKQKLLFERSNPPQPVVDDDLKKFIQQVVETCATAFMEKLEQKFETRFDALECQITQLRNEITLAQDGTRNGDTATFSEPTKDDMFHDGKQEDAENFFDLNFSQSSDINMNMDTQGKPMEGLSQHSNVTGLDPASSSKAQKPIPWWTPSTSFRVNRVKIPKYASPFGENWTTKRWKELQLTDDPIDPDKFEDSPLTYVSDDLWNQFYEWSMKPM
ncbi:hypothetical protein N665_0006s0158 [Sinapis alba]|nr:hypothetical protein N665_0006s0158 [Sinapis alba]